MIRSERDGGLASTFEIRLAEERARLRTERVEASGDCSARSVHTMLSCCRHDLCILPRILPRVARRAPWTWTWTKPQIRFTAKAGFNSREVSEQREQAVSGGVGRRTVVWVGSGAVPRPRSFTSLTPTKPARRQKQSATAPRLAQFGVQ